MKKVGIVFLIILFIFLLFILVNVEEKKDNKVFIDVFVVMLWIVFDLLRLIDILSVINLVDLWKWMKLMIFDEKLWLINVNKLEI